MSFKTTGLGQMRAALKRLERVPFVANEAMKTMALELKEKAQHNAPIDFGDLQHAIQIRRLGVQGAGGRFISGLSIYEVFVNNRTPVKDPDKHAEGINTVGDYAWEVHEHMGWGSRESHMMPSKKSVAHGAQYGAEAGGKFLERATIEMFDLVRVRMVDVVTKFTRTI